MTPHKEVAMHRNISPRRRRVLGLVAHLAVAAALGVGLALAILAWAEGSA